MLTGLAMIAMALLGVLTGLLAFKAKLQWCRRCGSTLACPSASVRFTLQAGRDDRAHHE